MADEIPPALTPEEWAIALDELRRTPHPEEMHADLPAVERAVRLLPTRWRTDAQQARLRMALENAYVQANRQPCGFTREDVAMLIVAAGLVIGAVDPDRALIDPRDSEKMARASVDVLLRLADRIAALLPPEAAGG